MKKYIQNLICKWNIHFPVLLYLSFWDKISGKAVLKFECNNCQKKWLANSKWNYFKSYIQ